MSCETNNIHQRPYPSVGECLLLVLVVAISGCQQGVYRASSLPPELAARPVIDTERLDLSRLGSTAMRSDRIYEGDVVQVTAVTGVENEGAIPLDQRVANDGTIGIPLVGAVRVAGLTVTEAENAIQRASVERQIFRDPSINVHIKDRRVNAIMVAGAVANPGIHQLPAANSSLQSALFAAGGLSKDADGTVDLRFPDSAAVPGLGHHIVRGQNGSSASWSAAGTPPDAASLHVDLVTAVSSQQGNFYLDDGTIVMVNKMPERVIHVLGLTGNRSITLTPGQDVHLLDALSQAGGPTFSIWISDSIKVIRKVPGTDRSATIKASIRKAKKDRRENIRLTAGDVVSVEENAITFTLSTLREVVGIGATAAQGAAAAIP